MNLKLKLPLAFCGVLAALMGAALIGIHSLNDSVDVYEVDVGAQHARERAIADVLVTFKTQVQEWKDTLLRGKDPAKLDKRWGAFAKREADVDDKAKALLASLPPGESRTLVEQFSAAHVKITFHIALFGNGRHGNGRQEDRGGGDAGGHRNLQYDHGPRLGLSDDLAGRGYTP